MRTEVQSPDQYRPKELQLNRCDVRQFLKMELQFESRYSLVNGILVSRVVMAASDSHTRLVGALRELTSKI